MTINTSLHGKLKLWFYHNSKRGTTRCFITRAAELGYLPIANGHAICNFKKGDHFSKAVGRKIALTKALANGTVDRPTRKEIWCGYWFYIKEGK